MVTPYYLSPLPPNPNMHQIFMKLTTPSEEPQPDQEHEKWKIKKQKQRKDKIE